MQYEKPISRRTISDRLLATRDRLPKGWSEENVPGLGFDLKLTIYKQFLGHSSPGFASVTYFGERVEGQLRKVIRKALKDKLAKLLGFQAQVRFLLFEMNVRSSTAWDVRNHLEELKNGYPGLARVDAVWVVDTSEVGRQARIFCTDAWPTTLGRGYFSVNWVDA